MSRARRWYLRPGGVPLPESAKGAGDGARYWCEEGGDRWHTVEGWVPPELESSKARSSWRRRNHGEELFDA